MSTSDKIDNLHMDAIATGLESMLDEWFGEEATFVLMVATPKPDGGGCMRLRTNMCENHTALTLANMAQQYAQRHHINVAELEASDDVHCAHDTQ